MAWWGQQTTNKKRSKYLWELIRTTEENKTERERELESERHGNIGQSDQGRPRRGDS